MFVLQRKKLILWLVGYPHREEPPDIEPRYGAKTLESLLAQEPGFGREQIR
jgi:hypothetical protein